MWTWCDLLHHGAVIIYLSAKYNVKKKIVINIWIDNVVRSSIIWTRHLKNSSTWGKRLIDIQWWVFREVKDTERIDLTENEKKLKVCS